jgi:hypothetical protein
MKTFPGKIKKVTGLLVLLTLVLLVVPNEVGAATTNEQSSPNIVTHVKNWSQTTPMEKAQHVCVLAALLLVAPVAEIWFIVAGFQVSVGWGLFMLFIGGMRAIFAALAMLGWMVRWVWLTHLKEPVQIPGLILGLFVVIAGTSAIIFITRHWEQARKPLAVMSLGVILVLVALAMEFVK